MGKIAEDEALLQIFQGMQAFFRAVFLHQFPQRRERDGAFQVQVKLHFGQVLVERVHGLIIVHAGGRRRGGK